MTLDDIRAMSKPTILANEAAQVLGCDPQWLRLMARERPEKLGFPVCCTSKHRVKIPREPFLRFLGMAEVKTYTLTLDAQELHDLIEVALVCECQAAQIIGGLKRKGLDLDAQKLVTQNARLARLVRRMQEEKEKAT